MAEIIEIIQKTNREIFELIVVVEKAKKEITRPILNNNNDAGKPAFMKRME